MTELRLGGRGRVSEPPAQFGVGRLYMEHGARGLPSTAPLIKAEGSEGPLTLNEPAASGRAHLATESTQP